MKEAAVSPPVQHLRRIRGGRRLADPLILSADTRRQDPWARLLRATHICGTDPLPTFWSTGKPNFGDALSPAVLEYVSGRRPVLVSRRCRRKVLAAGSVLHRLEAGDTVWGTGSMFDAPIQPPRDVLFLAVRGPLTRALIRSDVPDVYGDPAMLLPEFHKPESTDHRRSVGIVPHYVDHKTVSRNARGALVIDVRLPWQTVVREITSCDLILSSSLHGIIVAEAFGIPAVWITVTGTIVGGTFKYRDYYMSTDRDPPSPARWQDGLEAMTSRASAPPQIDATTLLLAWRSHLPFPDSVN